VGHVWNFPHAFRLVLANPCHLVRFGMTFFLDATAHIHIINYRQGTPSVIQVIFILMIPESPRWLIGKGRFEEARAVLTKYQ
jgi:hypothetical protein